MNLRKCLGAVLLVVMAVMISSCGGKEGKIRSEFVAGCASQGAPKSQCKCLYDKLEDIYGLDTMERMRGGTAVPADFTDTMISSAAQCQRM